MMERLIKPIAQIAALIPLAHLFVCSLFLAGYSGAFGARVGSLFAISDIFATSLSDLFIIYVTAVLVPLIGGMRIKHILTNMQDSEDTKSKIAKTADRAMLALGALMVLLEAFRMYRNEPVQYNLLIEGILLANIGAVFRFFEKVGLHGSEQGVAWLAVLLCAVAFGAGMSQGQLDRLAQYRTFVGRSYNCGKLIILRPASDKFIAVTPNNNRVLIDQTCKVEFFFPRGRLLDD
jgi:hypothetical protein